MRLPLLVVVFGVFAAVDCLDFHDGREEDPYFVEEAQLLKKTHEILSEVQVSQLEESDDDIYFDDWESVSRENVVPPSCPTCPTCPTKGKFKDNLLAWYFVGEDSFVRINERMIWINAQSYCCDYGLELYHPKNSINVARFLIDHFNGSADWGTHNHHVAGRGNGTHMLWLSGEVVGNDELLDKRTHRWVGKDDCLYLSTNPYYMEDEDFLRAWHRHCYHIDNLGYPLCGNPQSYTLTWHSVGEDKFARFTQRMDWEDARALCQNFGYDVYQPKDLLAVLKYLAVITRDDDSLLKAQTYYWLGATTNRTGIYWLSGGEIPKDSSLWHGNPLYYSKGCVIGLSSIITATRCTHKTVYPLCG